MSTRRRQSRPQEESNDSKKHPFHILMAENGIQPQDLSKLKLSGRLKRDYLSKRHRLQQLCKSVPANKETEAFWSGATPIELSLLSCCEVPKQSREDDYVVPGALKRAKIPKFIGLLTLDCHELGPRSLALAILERTWEADEETKEIVEAYTEDGDAVALNSPTKKAKTSDDPDGSSRIIAKIGIRGKADLLLTFFAGGGLRILSQWLMDASTPIFSAPPKQPPNSEDNQSRPKRSQPSEVWIPSKTGVLLLPLLVLLTYSPFDKDLVTDSKINKQIAKLSKAADAIAAEAQQNPRNRKVEDVTDPRVGGLPVKDVQKSLNDLKASWRTKEKQKDDRQKTPDPFARIKAALTARLDEANRYDKGEGEKPEWLIKGEAAQQKCKPSPPPSNQQKRASTEELARLEREKERHERMKGDLKRAAAERAKLLEKLRQLKQRQEQDAGQSTQSRKRKTVHWKDGFSSSSSSRNRELLEDISTIGRNEASNQHETT
ncbi:hypothetical protein ACA910_017756 [Epithemia clementina (nom. ined.)]